MLCVCRLLRSHLCFCIINGSVSFAELIHLGSLVPFVGSGEGMQFQTFLLDEEKSRLLLGAKDHIYLLDPDNINKNPRKVFTHMLTRTTRTPAGQVFSYFSYECSGAKLEDFFSWIYSKRT